MGAKAITATKSDRSVPILTLKKGDALTSKIHIAVPRYDRGVDLKDLAWSIKIKTADGTGDLKPITGAEVGENAITFDWILPQSVASSAGVSMFSIHGTSSAGASWESSAMQISIDPELAATAEYDPEDLSELDQFLNDVHDKLPDIEAVTTAANAATNAANTAAAGANNSKQGIENAWKQLYPEVSRNSVAAQTAAKQANEAIPGVYAAGNYANAQAASANTAATNATNAATNANNAATNANEKAGLAQSIYTEVKDAYESGELNGEDGKDGKDGTNGTDGVSPTLRVQTIDGGKRITIVDASGIKQFDIYNGEQGQPGQKGDPGAAGPSGKDGKDGSDAEVTATNIASALGYTPAKSSDVTSQSEKIETLEQLMPSSGATAGKVLKVLSVNADGTFVCEWADAGAGGGVSDVKVDGTSVVSDGIASVSAYNVTKSGLTADGAAWTADEQAAARERIGAVGDSQWTCLFSGTLDTDTKSITAATSDTPLPYTQIFIATRMEQQTSNISGYLRINDSYYLGQVVFGANNAVRTVFCDVRAMGGGKWIMYQYEYTGAIGSSYACKMSGLQKTGDNTKLHSIDSLTSIEVRANTTFPAGMCVEIYAR